MKKLIILSIIFLFSYQSHAQNWTEPVDVSHMGGLNVSPNFCIDNNGNIHCVWEHTFNQNHSAIFYSWSNDNGNNWSVAENISQNDEKRAIRPHIVHDSQNNLHLTYDYDVISTSIVQIHYRKYNS